MTVPIVRETKDGVVLSIHVHPNASRTEWAGLYGDALKIRVAAPPVDGAANEALTTFLSDALAVPRAMVRVQSGASGRRKQVCIQGRTAAQVRARLPLPSQKGTVTS